jgi:hypothetical protein
VTARLFDPAVEPASGFVYPRLPRAAARQLVEERSDWSTDQLRQASATSHPAAAPAAAGNVVPDQRLSRVREAVRTALSQADPPLPPQLGARVAEFDRTVGCELYNGMQILPGDAASEGVWSFMTLVLLPELGPWRFPDGGDKRYLGVPRNVLRRTWWRAHVLGPDLGGHPDGSPYLGEDELVQIFERPTLAANPWVARAVVASIFRAAPEITVARSQFVRDLTRRLLRLTPLVSLDALPEKELDDLLDDLVAQSKVALQPE